MNTKIRQYFRRRKKPEITFFYRNIFRNFLCCCVSGACNTSILIAVTQETLVAGMLLKVSGVKSDFFLYQNCTSFVSFVLIQAKIELFEFSETAFFGKNQSNIYDNKVTLVSFIH
jgi:hypothetical protein